MTTNKETLSHCWLKLSVDFYDNEMVDYLMSNYGSDYIFLYQLLFSETVKLGNTQIDINSVNYIALKFYSPFFIKNALTVYKSLGIDNINKNSLITNYKRLIYRQRNSPEYELWRNSVFKRDNYVCQHCKQGNKVLNAHHIKFWADRKDLRFNIDNGITLCVDCHKKIHKKKGTNYAEKND